MSTLSSQHCWPFLGRCSFRLVCPSIANSSWRADSFLAWFHKAAATNRLDICESQCWQSRICTRLWKIDKMAGQFDDPEIWTVNQGLGNDSRFLVLFRYSLLSILCFYDFSQLQAKHLIAFFLSVYVTFHRKKALQKTPMSNIRCKMHLIFEVPFPCGSQHTSFIGPK